MNVQIPSQRKVINFYGTEKQTGIHMEELAELIQAISKMRRVSGADEENAGLAYYNLVEEISDVLISIEQLKEIYDISNWEIQWMIDHKCLRQEARMHDAIRRGRKG